MENSPIEIAYYKTYSFGIPSNYYSMWGYLDSFFGLNDFSAIFLQRIISMLLLLNSSFLLTGIFFRVNSESTIPSSYFLTLQVVISLLLSFNPLLTFIYPYFGFSYIAFMNFAIYLSLCALISKNRFVDMKVIIPILGAGFFLTLAIIVYPLILVFYVTILLSIGLPVALYIKKKMRFALITLFTLVIYSLSAPSIYSLFEAVAAGETFSYNGIAHVFNLVYYIPYITLPQVSNILYSLTGLNSIAFPNSLYLMAILIIVLLLIIVMLFLFSNNKIFISFLLLAFSIILLLNLDFSGHSIVENFVIYSITRHILTFNHYGSLMTVFDGNREMLFLFWYVFSAIIATSVSSFKFNTKIAGKSKKILTETIKFSPIPVIVVLLILLIPIGSSSIPSIQQTPSFNYTESFPYYNQFLFTQNTTNFGNAWVFPPAYVTEPLGNDYPLLIETLQAQSSPFFKQIDGDLPPSTTLVNPSDPTLYGISSPKIGEYKLIRNFNESNVIAGYPVFVIGSFGTFNNLVQETASEIIPNSTRTLSMQPVLGGMNNSPMPNYYLDSLNSSTFMSISFQMKMNGSQVYANNGGFMVGIDSNSSTSGYGTGNSFVGLGISYDNGAYSYFLSAYSGFPQNFTGWNIDVEFTNSDRWESLAFLTYEGRNLALNFSIIETRVGSMYFIYVNIDDKWYYINSYNTFQQEALTFQEYRQRTKNISLNVSYSLIKVGGSIPLLPIMYDTPFGDGKSFLSSLNTSSYVVFGKNYDIQDLIFSYLAYNSNASITIPSAYAINYPQKGWFQVFPSNDPQGAYYAESINPSILPIQVGYGPSVGYAESILDNSSFQVPLKRTVSSGDTVAMNILYSPMGGILKLNFGNSSYRIDTFSNTSYFKWVYFNSTCKFSAMSVENVRGIQSINLILSFPSVDFSKSAAVIGRSLEGKNIIREDGKTLKLSEGNIPSPSGQFDYNQMENKISVGNASSNFALLLPYLEPSSYSVTAEGAQVSLEPFWGSIVGVFVHCENSRTIHIKMTAGSFYSGIQVYLSPFAISLIVLIERLRKK
ncbi:MAG: hypothetical protein QW478_05780 [Candidatus Micrarchaeaceae archaeon]